MFWQVAFPMQSTPHLRNLQQGRFAFREYKGRFAFFSSTGRREKITWNKVKGCNSIASRNTWWKVLMEGTTTENYQHENNSRLYYWGKFCPCNVRCSLRKRGQVSPLNFLYIVIRTTPFSANNSGNWRNVAWKHLEGFQSSTMYGTEGIRPRNRAIKDAFWPR